MIDEEVPEELGQDVISIAPSLYTHSSVIANIQNKMIESSQKIQNDPTILKSSTTNDLFKEDNLDISSFDPDNPKYKSKPHEVHFQTLLFFKFLLFSFLFSIAGPLTVIVFYWKHKQLIYNFQWLGLSWPVFFTYVRFAIDLLIIIGFILEPFDMTSYSLAIYYTIAFVSELVFQNLMLAFYHPQKIDLLQRFPLQQIINRFENQINPFLWTTQPRSLIEFELEQSMKRNHIEPGLFVCYFIVLPNEKRREIISHKFENLKVQKYAGNGLKMAVEIIEYFNKQSSIYLYISVAILLTMIRLALTIFYSQFWEESWCKIFQFIAITAIHTVGYGCIASTMMITLRDLQRKVFSLNQLSHLISAQQVEEYDETKIFPTLNFLCVQSLFSWQNLRKVLLDYGLQYYQRENALISYFLEVVFALIVVIIVTNFQVINIFQDTGLACIRMLLFLIGFDVLTIIFLAILIVLQGARINKHYGLHQTMLKKNMFTYQQLSTQSFIKKEYHVQPQDFMFKTLKNTIDKIEIHGSKNWFFLYSQYVINAIDQAYNDLCYEEEQKPFTVLGIAMTNKLAIQLIASFLGILGTVISSTYSNFNF